MDNRLTGSLGPAGHQRHRPTADGPRPANVAPSNIDNRRVGRHSPSTSLDTLPPRRSPEAEQRLLKVQAKGTPYAATGLQTGVHLNGRVVVATTDDGESAPNQVTCHHFAQAFVEQQGKKRRLMEAFSTSAGIVNTFNRRLEAVSAAYDHAGTAADPASIHLVTEEHVGRYMAALATALADPAGTGPSEVNCLLSTPTHSMALHVARKSKDGVSYFAAKLYDPNSTASYQRVEAESPAGLERLTFRDLLILPAFADQYAGHPGTPVAMVAVCLDPHLQPAMDRRLATTSPENLQAAMAGGSLEDVRTMLQLVFTSDAPDDLKVRLLESRGNTATPGFSFAMQEGHASTVEAFVQAVDGSGLPAGAKVDLLTARDDDDIPALTYACSSGRARSVEAFARAVLASGLPTEQKVELLSPCWPDGMPGLHSAYRQGHKEAVTAFVQAVTASDLPEELQVALVAAKDDDGVPGVALAFDEGQLKTIEAFVHAVTTSSLPDARKVDLLAAKDGDGKSALSYARDAENEPAMDAFVSAVNRSNLSAAHKAELIGSAR